MTEQSPITPPHELKQQWFNEAPRQDYCSATDYAIAKSSQWGYEQRGAANEAELQKARDEELEACIAWMMQMGYWGAISRLRAARRPKPKSLKEQALETLKHAEEGWRPVPEDIDIICRALEQLDG